jgi:restriction endonuclease S subunit
LEELLDAHFDWLCEQADDSWSTASLLDIANYKNGLAMQKFRPQPGDKGLPVLKIRELGQGECGPDADRCSIDIEESVRVHDGDLIFSWSGTLLLDFWAGGEAGLNQHLFKVTSNKYPSWFYYMWTKHHMKRFIAMAKDRATTMGHIKRSALANAQVIIPPQDLLARQTKLMQPVVDQMIGLKVESKRLAEFRDALLPRLMSGEIDVSQVEVPTQLNSHLSAD